MVDPETGGLSGGKQNCYSLVVVPPPQYDSALTASPLSSGGAIYQLSGIRWLGPTTK